MNLSWKIIKVVFALIIVVGVIFWGIDSVRTRFYSGDNLNFVVGRGTVTMTNPSDQPVPVQLVGSGSRSFAISSTFEGLSGTSIKQGTGGTSSQLFEFNLPVGISEFLIVRGTSSTTTINLIASPNTPLEANVQPLAVNETRTTLIATAAVVLGALFYISRTTNHRFVNMLLRRQEAPAPILQPAAETALNNQGRALHPYGDNRADTSH